MNGDTIFVEAAGRLHFGVLDRRGALGRWCGGVGTSAPAPTLLVSATRADTLEVSGPDADRARDAARRVLGHFGITAGVRIRILRALPAHAGLGSGTQLALAVARAVTELYDVGADAAMLARVVGRARRSAIGTWTFAAGGLVVDGGRLQDHDEVSPLLVRLPFPASWRCIVAVPSAQNGISGAAEAAAFAALPPPPERDVERVAHLVLMALLPALADADLRTFGTALTEIQTINGRWFAPAQGGTFAPGPGETILRRMMEWGACGVGQSSWGPAVYGITSGDDAAARLAGRVRALLGDSGTVYEGPFRTEGARVWRGQAEP